MRDNIMKTSIKARFLRLGILCAFVMGLVLVAVTTYMMFDVTTRNATNTANYISSSTASIVGSEIEYIAETLSESPISDEASSTFSRVFLFGKDTGYNYSEIETLCKEVNSLQVLSPKDNSSVVIAGIKLSDNSIKCGEMDVEYFNEILLTFGANEGDFGFVTNSEGNIAMSYNKNDIIGQPLDALGLSSIKTAVVNGENGTIVIGNDFTNGVRYLYSYAMISDYGYGVVYATNYNTILSSYYQMLVMVIIIYLVLLTIGVVVSIKIGNAVSKPIKEVTERLVKLSEGDLKTEFSPNTRGDETQVISEALVSVLSSLGSYISDIDTVLDRIAKGDITAKSSVDYKGDFIKIGDSLAMITNSLADTLSTIKSSIVQFTSGSESVALGAKTLADNSVSEAGTLERLNDMVASIKKTIEANYEETNNANQLSEVVINNVRAGSKDMTEMSEAVANIKEASDKIQSVVKIIDNIAFQTNILALNAAVEAARAGDAGKGFAVVAGEVRNLAAKSAEAVKNTVVLVNECSEAVAKGEVLTQNANQSFSRIDTSMSEFSSLIARIADSSSEQTKAIEEITSDIDSISGVVTANSATAEESAAASEQLNSNAGMLNSKVDYFKL